MSLPSINFLHLTVSEIQLGQTFSHCPPTHPDTMGENNTPTALKGCGVKNYVIHWLTWNFFLKFDLILIHVDKYQPRSL